MKKIVTFIAPALLLLCGGCANDDGPDIGVGEGAIALHVAADGSVTDAVPVTRASQATIVPETADLKLAIEKKDGTYSKSWNSVADFPADSPFKIGEYSMKAFYGDATEEGFEKPYYEGTADFLVEEGKTTEVNLTASLANTMVSISYTEAFRNYFSSYSSQLHSEGGDFITFLSDEVRPAYLRPGKVTVTLSITKLNGVSATIQPAEFEALAKHHYHITLDVNNGQTGEGELKVIFDDSVVTEDVTVDLSDDVLSAPEPVVKAQGFTPGTPIEVMEYSPASEPLRMTLAAAGGLRAVTLTTQSEQLIAKGFPAEINLMEANPSQQALLKTFGLDVQGLWKNPDKMAVLDFTEVFKNVGGEGTHSFALVVKDKLGKVNLPVILEAKTQSVTLNIAGTPSAYVNATEASLDITTDAPEIKGNVSVEIYNFGTWGTANIISSAPKASARHRAAGQLKTYTLKFNIPADAADQQVRVKFKNNIKATSSIEKHGAILTLESENNVFASKATFKVTRNPKVALSSLNFFYATSTGSYVTASGVSLDEANSRVTINGLTPGTAYMVKADEGTSASAALYPCHFTTESALQLPNSGMEDWVKNGSGSYWECYYPSTDAASSVWGTNNPMTTSQGASYAYVRISGTKPADGRTGQCARISTQGWGSGNTATGSKGTSGECKYTDAGLLHLGASRTTRPSGYGNREGSLKTDDLNCGLSFASRPSALNFYFRYEPYNSADTGVAIVKVYNSLNQVIASGEVSLGKQDSFVQKSIPLTYSANAAKATKIYVCFMSTNQEAALNRSWLGGPGFANLSRGEFYGSRLYIDDISLSY